MTGALRPFPPYGAYWRICGFDVIYRRDEFTAAIPGQRVEIDPQALKRYCPSYRHLCYSLELNGFPVRHDLPGEDQSETARAVMQKVFHWAGLEQPD